MAVFTCSGAVQVNDMLAACSTGSGDSIFQWIGMACATCADDQANVSLLSTELENRVCGVYSQPTTIQAQWVGTITRSAAAQTCVSSAGNFWATGCGASTGTIVVSGDFTQIPLNQNDSIQFTIQLNIT